MILRRKRPERKDEVQEFPVWNVHEAHGRSTAVDRNAPSRTQTIILQVIYFNGRLTRQDTVTRRPDNIESSVVVRFWPNGGQGNGTTRMKDAIARHMSNLTS